MWTRNVKKHIRCSRTPLRSKDVGGILAALEAEADTVRDATDAFPVQQFWEGQGTDMPCFPPLREVILLDVGSVVVEIGSGFFKKDPHLVSIVELFRPFSRSKQSSIDFTGKIPGRADSIHLSISSVGPELLVALSHKPKVPVGAVVTKEILSDLVAAGSWPVSLHVSADKLNALHETGGKVEFRPQIREIQFSCPNQSLRAIVKRFEQMVRSLRFTLRGTEWFLEPGGGMITSWRELNRLITGMKQTGLPLKKVHLNKICWRLKNYKAFDSIAELHAVLNPKEQITTRLLEFKFRGHAGFMELGHDHKGYYVWFSFDTEQPFAELQKIIGYPLKEWE